MANHTADQQVAFVAQWFNTWSDFQKDDFVVILSQKIAPEKFINGLVNGIQNMDVGSGRPPSLFACQVKLFNEWWANWNESDKERFTTSLKTADSKFWSEVEAELDGSRKKLDECFFTVSTNPTSADRNRNVTSTNNNNAVEVAEEATENINENNSNKTTITVSSDNNTEAIITTTTTSTTIPVGQSSQPESDDGNVVTNVGNGSEETSEVTIIQS